MAMEINIQNLQKKIPLKSRAIQKIVEAILKFQKVKTSDLTFVFVTSQKIAALNKRFLGRQYATDVLAFDATEGSGAKSRVLAGDVIISTDAVIKNSKAFESSQKEELVLYIIHGILHLLGYDDHNPADVQKMRAQEQKVLQFLGVEIEKVF